MTGLGTHCALLVIDVQQGFNDPVWGARNNPSAEAKIARLLHAFRASGRTILHVLHDSRLPDSPLRPGQSGNDPKPEAQPLPGEPIYRKQVNSAFIGTALESDLRRDGIDTLVIVGLTTNHCVSTTTRMAGNLGFHTFLVHDGTATFDRASLDGQNRPAAEVHAAALSDLSEEFATIVSTDDVLQQLAQRA
ncbi:cysteine hydrolase family protein [Terriglobus sp.]|uniref:cysteine hydrolase family protein n=1 Tax=Terriglobus sp. TaxID=1889013 RepID=UPI003B00B6DC